MRTGILNSTNILLENVSYAVYGLSNLVPEAYSVIDINICNRGYDTANIQLYVSNGGTNFDIETSIPITGSNVYLITGVAVSAGDTIFVKSDAPNISVSVYGAQFEIDELSDLPLPSIAPEDSISGPSPLANDRFGDTVYANDSFYLVSSEQGVYMYSTVDDSLLTTFTNPGSANNGFGDSISASDYFVFIAAPLETSGVANGSGAVYIYSSINYLLLSTLTNATVQNFYGSFGTCLESNNDYLLVGDTDGGDSAASGSILVYDTTSLTYLGLLTRSTLLAGDDLGTNVSIDGSFVVAGVPNANTVLTFSAASQSFGIQITAPQDTNTFGYSIDTRAGTIVVGDPTATVNTVANAGRAFVYDNSGNLVTELQSPIELLADDRFGESVGLTPEFILVGAPGIDSDAADNGQVFTYLYDGTFVATITI